MDKVLVVCLFRYSAERTMTTLHKPACGPEIYWKPPRTNKFTRIFPASSEDWTQEKSTYDKEGSRYRNYGAAFGPILRISKGFHRSKQNLYIYFLFDQASKNFKKPAAHVHKFMIQFKGL